MRGTTLPHDRKPLDGRGSLERPPNRFERTWHEREPDDDSIDDDPAPATELIEDSSRTIIASNESPDVGFEVSVNPYRGCEHGCIYCYARPTHEYLGFSSGLDFETKIVVKSSAPELLRGELSKAAWRPRVIAMSGVTDPYQPVERRLRLTRGCLEVLAEFRNPVAIVTKNRLVARDGDLLAELARFDAAAVFLSITTLDDDLARRMEPRASRPAARLEAIEELAGVGVPVGVMVAPVIPGLNDHEIPAILEAAAKAGARFAGFVPIRLPLGVGALFESWLDRHYPARKEKVLGRIRSLRGGRLNDARFGSRMRGEGPFADLIRQVFQTACQRAGFDGHGPALSTSAFRRGGMVQGVLF